MDLPSDFRPNAFPCLLDSPSPSEKECWSTTVRSYTRPIDMKIGTMFFSLLQVPRCRINSIANYWDETFHSSRKIYGNNSSVRLLCSRIYGQDGGHGKRWSSRRPVTTKTEGQGNKQTTWSTRSRIIKPEISSETLLASTALNVNKTQLLHFQDFPCCDIQLEIAQNKDLSSKVTVIVFDTETDALSRVRGRIIEIALRDLQGGVNSTFQTLVNPERYITNSYIHGITTKMVNRPDVPRMEELIPILLQYIRSRQKPGGYVLWVGHNARCFDVPFLINEFRRFSVEIPPNWLFVDTLPLARELKKSTGTKLSSTTLEALRELYGIQVDGSAHRAMVDVNTLSSILPRLTFDLKLTLSGLVQRSFTESDLVNAKRKKNSG